MNNIPYLLALHSINGLGPIRLKHILDYFKDPKLAWEASFNDFLKLRIPGNVIDLLINTRKTLQPQSYVENIKNSGIKWITLFDENYPKLLKEIYDPPVVLYYKGTIEFAGSDSIGADEKAIAVVGSRKMSGYGKLLTESFVKGLVDNNITVLSGLARGIDSQAHLTTINNKGRTLAILGGGLNYIYPPENRKLAENIIAGHGAIISEYAPEIQPIPGNFPARNRIISGLSLAVLVIEAAENSGSLITAKLALEQGRDVFAVPGPITSNTSMGPINLIKQGAKPVVSINDILDELNIHF